MERKQRAKTLSWAFLALVAAGLVLVNVLGHMANVRADVTKNEQFTLSKGSKRLVREGLQEKMTAKVYVTRPSDLPKVRLFVDDLIQLMERYREASDGNFVFEVIEPETEEQKKEAEEAGLTPVPLAKQSATGDQATLAQGYMGIVFNYGSETEVIEALQPSRHNQGLEFQVTNKIREIRDRAEDSFPRVGLIKKEGLTLGDNNLVPSQGRGGMSMKKAVGQYFPFYKFSDVDLEGGKAAIDPELDGVIVMQAKKAWTDAELARIDEFLMRGGKSLLVVAGAVNMKAADASMKAKLDTRGLDKLTKGYGISIHDDVVFDLTTQLRLGVRGQMGGTSTMITAPGILQIQHDDDAEEGEQPLDQSFAGFFRLEQLAFPYPSSLETVPSNQPAAETKTVARTSDSAYAQTGDSVDLSLKSLDSFKPTGEQGQRAIAVTVKGKLKSAVAANDELSAPDDVDIPGESAAPSRVLVISSPLFLANPFAHAGNPPPMPPKMAMMGAAGGDRQLQQIARAYVQPHVMVAFLAFKNLLDWMTGAQDLLAVSAKLIGAPSLSYQDVEEPDIAPDDTEEVRREKMEEFRQGRKELQDRVQWTLTLFPPLLFIAFGVYRWQRREAKRASMKV